MLSVRSLTVFKEKIPVIDVELKFVCQTSAVDVVVVVNFSSVKRAYTFASYSLSNCQVSGCDKYL